MKKMKSLISAVALVLMLVSMFSICVLPASAASEDDYDILSRVALKVNTAWKGAVPGEPVTYAYNDGTGVKTKTEAFDVKRHFASFDAAWDYAASINFKNPVIMICGTYDEEIIINGAVTIIGANAGIDPVKDSKAKNKPWMLSDSFVADSYITGSIVVASSAKNADITFDGVRFGEGGAYIDYYRTSGESDLTFKNVVFDKAGNDESHGYAVSLFSEGQTRNVTMENIYATGQKKNGLISPYFSKFEAKRIAYVNNSQGFLNKTSFSVGVAPYIKITESCFYNDAAPSGPVISMDNMSETISTLIDGSLSDTNITASDQRPSSLLVVNNCVFYNASSSNGLIHYEFVNKNSSFDLRDNYIYSSVPTSVLAPEFLLDSINVDQTACIQISNNRLLGAYMVPDLNGANSDTYVDMSYNYFGDFSGNAVEKPVFVNPDKARLIRTAYWTDLEMTKLSTDPIWSLGVNNWSMYSIDNFNYEIVFHVFEETGATEFKPAFTAHKSSKIKIYKEATIEDGVYTKVSNPVDSIKISNLSDDVYANTVYYLQITNSEYPSFAPIYKISLENMGSIDKATYFAKEFPDVFMYQPSVVKNSPSNTVPYRWHGKVYKMEIGKSLFGDMKSLMAYAKKQGYDIPNIAIPAGVYTDDLVLYGSCNIMGEQYGVNPNVKPVDVVTPENIGSAGWTLSPERADDAHETIFNACIRVAPSASDFSITIDGIKMGEGCSYVDDVARADGITNVVIFRNVIAENAGGGKDSNGLDNIYLFNFNKVSSSANPDIAHVYLYDVRIDRNQKCHVFGPYIEKLVIDNIFYGNAMQWNGNNRSFMTNFRSRDIPNPYYSITNSCFYNNAKSNTNSKGLGGFYAFSMVDDQGNQAVKKDIVYNFDNNLFYNGFGSGNAAMQVKFPGTNMKFYLTNNIIVDTKDARVTTDTFFAGNATTRWSGNAMSYDCSDQIICKGNRIVNLHQIPLTHATGMGTVIDYSGNYWANELTDETGLAPDQIKYATGRNPAYTEAEHTKGRVEFTYLNWGMTERSDAAFSDVALYKLNKGMFGTGSYKSGQTFDGEKLDVFTDTVSPDLEKYEIPAEISACCDVTIEKRNGANDYASVLAMAPVAGQAETVFKVKVTSQISGVSKAFIVVLKSAKNNMAKFLDFELYSGDEYCFIDEENKTVYIHTKYKSVPFMNGIKNRVIASYGATVEFYSDKDCKIASDVASVAYGSETLHYVKITSENGSASNVYTIKLSRYNDQNPIKFAAVNGITNMTYTGNNTYTAYVKDTITFKPELYKGSTAKVYNGSKLVASDDGVYTVENIGNGLTYKMVVTAQDGVATKTYTLRFVYAKSDKCDVLSVEGGIKTDTGLLWNMNFANVGVVNVKVSEGATYQLYADQSLQKPLKGNQVTITDDHASTIYIKVTAEDGKSTKTYPISVLTYANVSAKPAFFAKVGKAEYPAYLTGFNEYAIYLPAGTATTNLTVKTNTDQVDCVVVYSSIDRGVIVREDSTIKLDQKLTTLYYTQNASKRTIEFEGKMVASSNPEEQGVIRIYSDRKPIAYKDSAKITSWAKEYVDFLNNGGYGIMIGDEKGNFNASKQVTRYQIAVIAAHIMGIDVTQYAKYQLNYSDKIVSWAAPYVRAVSATGIMVGNKKGSKFIFDGNSPATREQLAVIMVNIALMNAGKINPNSMVDTDLKTGADYYNRYKNVEDAVYNSIDFVDEAKVASWAKPYMRLAVDFGIMSGSLEKGKLYLKPKGYVTRAQIAVMAAQYLAK